MLECQQSSVFRHQRADGSVPQTQTGTGAPVRQRVRMLTGRGQAMAEAEPEAEAETEAEPDPGPNPEPNQEPEPEAKAEDDEKVELFVLEGETEADRAFLEELRLAVLETRRRTPEETAEAERIAMINAAQFSEQQRMLAEGLPVHAAASQVLTVEGTEAPPSQPPSGPVPVQSEEVAPMRPCTEAECWPSSPGDTVHTHPVVSACDESAETIARSPAAPSLPPSGPVPVQSEETGPMQRLTAAECWPSSPEDTVHIDGERTTTGPDDEQRKAAASHPRQNSRQGSPVALADNDRNSDSHECFPEVVLVDSDSETDTGSGGDSVSESESDSNGGESDNESDSESDSGFGSGNEGKANVSVNSAHIGRLKTDQAADDKQRQRTAVATARSGATQPTTPLWQPCTKMSWRAMTQHLLYFPLARLFVHLFGFEHVSTVVARRFQLDVPHSFQPPAIGEPCAPDRGNRGNHDEEDDDDVDDDYQDMHALLHSSRKHTAEARPHVSARVAAEVERARSGALGASRLGANSSSCSVGASLGKENPSNANCGKYSSDAKGLYIPPPYQDGQAIHQYVAALEARQFDELRMSLLQGVDPLEDRNAVLQLGAVQCETQQQTGYLELTGGQSEAAYLDQAAWERQLHVLSVTLPSSRSTLLPAPDLWASVLQMHCGDSSDNSGGCVRSRLHMSSKQLAAPSLDGGTMVALCSRRSGQMTWGIVQGRADTGATQQNGQLLRSTMQPHGSARGRGRRQQLRFIVPAHVNFSRQKDVWITEITNVTTAMREFQATHAAPALFNPIGDVLCGSLVHRSSPPPASSSSSSSSSPSSSSSLPSSSCTGASSSLSYAPPPRAPRLFGRRVTKLWRRLEQELNADQIHAIEVATQGTHGPITLIEGPPGTGKTTTVAAIVSAILAGDCVHFRASGKPGRPLGHARSRILMCAPSNSAVDELVRRLSCGIWDATGEHRRQPAIVRIGGGGERRTTDTRGTRESTDPVVLRASFDYQLDELRQRKGKTFKFDEAVHEIFGNAEVVCATLSGAAHYTLVDWMADHTSLVSPQSSATMRPFSALIIDEAAQSTEPSSLIPMRYNPGSVILVGDSKQLPATLFSPRSARNGYDRSLMERLRAKGIVTNILREQYRMHPSLCRYISNVFYDGALRSHPSVTTSGRTLPTHTHRQLKSGVVFHNVAGREESSLTSRSWFNVREAQYIAALYERFRTACEALGECTPKVAIISAYRQQVLHLRRHCRRFLTGADSSPDLEISTVDSFQGQERPVVIFSCVRVSRRGVFAASSSSSSSSRPPSSTVGFLSDLRRLCVALSRAQCALWIVGHYDTLVSAMPHVFQPLCEHIFPPHVRTHHLFGQGQASATWLMENRRRKRRHEPRGSLQQERDESRVQLTEEVQPKKKAKKRKEKQRRGTSLDKR